MSTRQRALVFTFDAIVSKEKQEVEDTINNWIEGGWRLAHIYQIGGGDRRATGVALFEREEGGATPREMAPE